MQCKRKAKNCSVIKDSSSFLTINQLLAAIKDITRKIIFTKMVSAGIFPKVSALLNTFKGSAFVMIFSYMLFGENSDLSRSILAINKSSLIGIIISRKM